MWQRARDTPSREAEFIDRFGQKRKPRSRHDDIVDALGLAGQLLNKWAPGGVPKIEPGSFRPPPPPSFPFRASRTGCVRKSIAGCPIICYVLWMEEILQVENALRVLPRDWQAKLKDSQLEPVTSGM